MRTTSSILTRCLVLVTCLAMSLAPAVLGQKVTDYKAIDQKASGLRSAVQGEARFQSLARLRRNQVGSAAHGKGLAEISQILLRRQEL